MRDKFILPLPPALNQQLNLARANKYKAAKSKKQWTLYITDIIKQQGYQQFTKPVWLTIRFQISNFNRDPDNLMASLKPILDAFKLVGVIPDDSLKWIKSPMVTYYDRGDDTIIIEVSDDVPSNISTQNR